MPAFYIFDQDEQSGPFQAQQIAAMWKQGLLTANAQYFDERTREWRSASELASPIATAFKRGLEELKRPKSAEELLEQKRLERKIALWIYVPIGVVVLLVVVVLLTSGRSSNTTDPLESERQGLVQEGKAVTGAMENANRDKDWSRVQQIKEREKEFYRHSAEYMMKREKAQPGATP